MAALAKWMLGIKTEPVNRTKTPSTKKAHSQIGQNLVPILFMGCGSSKTELITSVCGCCKDRRRIVAGSQSATEVRSHFLPRTLSNQSSFKLIDSPTFDNINMTDLQVFTKVAEYLLHDARIKHGIARIIYVHRAGDRLCSGSLRRTLRVLLDLFTDGTERERLTLLISRQHGCNTSPQAVVEEIHRSRVPIFKEAMNRGIRIIAQPSGGSSFANFLLSDPHRRPTFPPIYRIYRESEDPSSVASINPYFEARLGYHGKEVANDPRITPSGKILNELQASAAHYRSEYNRLKLLNIAQREEIASLRHQLEQTQRDYGSLQSQVQIHMSIDQEEVVQGLQNLNQHIESFARSISELIADGLIEVVFGSTKVTTLDAKNRAKLKSILAHHEGKSSLVESWDGKGLDGEEFLDYSIRNLICSFLHKNIFQPFHPYLNPSDRTLRSVHDVLVASHQEAQRQEPQYMSGKWRSIAFRSIGSIRHLRTGLKLKRVDPKTLSQEFLCDHLYPLLRSFLGEDEGVFTLEQEKQGHLHQLISVAWDWNFKLKEKVIALGDYTQTSFAPCDGFDPVFMGELPVGHNLRCTSTYILGTLAFGLVCRRGNGKGQEPTSKVLAKALVATDLLYTEL